MTAVISFGASNRLDALASVFPTQTFTTPTPETTPNVGSLASPGVPFGGFNIPQNNAEESVQFNRAWSITTRYLTLQTVQERDLSNPRTAADSEINALSVICRRPSGFKELRAWYANETGVHFRHHVAPVLEHWQQPISVTSASDVLGRTTQLLRSAQNGYLSSLISVVDHTSSMADRQTLLTLLARLREDLFALYLEALPCHRLLKTMSAVFYQQMKSSLEHQSNTEACHKRGECWCTTALDESLLATIYDIGLGQLGQQAFATAFHKFLEVEAIERPCFRVDWTSHASVVPNLVRWIEQRLASFAQRTISILQGGRQVNIEKQLDAQAIVRTAVTNIGRLRTSALFDYTKRWPSSIGALLDIQSYLVIAPQDKARVCEHFIQQVKRRLLHAGASTTEILSIYVDLIPAFKLLDARGVLLEKVAQPLRSYLRSREDTVAILAASFFADVSSDGSVDHIDPYRICADITNEVARSALVQQSRHKVLTFEDMEWLPDPIDAGPDFKISAPEDVLAHVLGLFEQEDFIKEVTIVLAQHLLEATDPEYVRETRLVELFKTRLDSTKLQAAEVMLKDMRDSVTLNRRINAPPKQISVPTPREIQAAIPSEGVTLTSLYGMFERRMTPAQFRAALSTVANKRQDRYYARRTPLPPEPPANAEVTDHDIIDSKYHVLSSFFWPQMRGDTFKLPALLNDCNRRFDSRFTDLGNQRKLHFKDALARVTVEIELEDRTVCEADVPGWRASVIDLFAFHPQSDMDIDDGLTPTFALDQIASLLQMDEELVLDALSFWLSKRVLYQPQPDMYAVLERQDMDVGPTKQTKQDTKFSALKSQDAMFREGVPTFETFIAEMLRNNGPREIGGMTGIAGMLKMVLPNFTYGEDEARWLLEDMESRGMVVRNGEIWAIG